MPQLLRRRLRCFYCSKYSRNEQPGIPRTWFCGHCEAMNHLDERGEITDPPAQADSPVNRVQYASARTPPAMAPPAPPAFQFCDTCTRNQMIAANAIAAFLPDEDDPEYRELEARVEEYRTDVQVRFPPVCENCRPGIEEQIRRANYGAKTTNLLRVLEQSQKVRQRILSRTFMREMQWIDLGKWAYFASVIVGVTWHTLGAFAWRTPDVPNPSPFWRSAECALQLWRRQCVGSSCFNPSPVISLVGLSLIADLGSVFAWHPKLKQLKRRPGGKLTWETPRWQSRLALLAVRIYVFWTQQDPPEGYPDRQDFHYWHIAMSVSILIVLLMNLLVKLVYPELIGSSRRHDSDMPGDSTLRSTGISTTRPNTTSFDTMSHVLTSSLREPGDSRHIPDVDSPPPSPTESSTSDSDIYTPRANRRIDADADAMDWTPTQRRFGKQPVHVERSLFAQKSTESASPSVRHRPTPTQRTKADTNPFRTKVPKMPQHPAREKANPFKPPIFAQALPEIRSGFLENFRWANERPDSPQRLVGAQRSTVRRDEELFRQPQLVHDWRGYVGEKRTGFEDRFGTVTLSDERRAPDEPR